MHLRAVQHQMKSLDCSMMAALEPGGRFTTEPRMLRLGLGVNEKFTGKLSPACKLDRCGLSAISGAGIISGLVGGRHKVSRRASAMNLSRRHIAGGFDQASEVGRRRDRNKIVSGSGGPRCGIRRDRWCARLQPASQRLRPETKVWRSTATCASGRGRRPHRSRAPQPPPRIGTNDEILQLLARVQCEHAAFAPAVLLVDFLIAGAFHKQSDSGRAQCFRWRKPPSTPESAV